MYFSNYTNRFGAPPGTLDPSTSRGTLPYREAMEQTERGAYEQYVRSCNGVTVTENVDRAANTPLERVQILERVLAALPTVFKLKANLDAQVRARNITAADAARNLAQALRPLGYHPSYVLSSERDELAKAQCALDRARWDFMAFQRNGTYPCNPNLDLTARSIIAAASDTTVPIETRAVRNVQAILNTYYPGEVGKVSQIKWNEPLNGLVTTRVGTGATATGIISVGRYFTNQTRDALFARRVLQVGHELRHIDQYRAGMIGDPKKAEREFLAHFWTATTPAKPGTGCVAPGTLVSVIDCSLSFRNCMTATDQARYPWHERTLLDRRSRLRPTTPWPPASGMPACPPSGC